jgi:4-nitrophenyl phosphatase
MITLAKLNGIPALEQRVAPADRPIRGIISDLDGVAYRGDTPIEDSVKAFRGWSERGLPYAFVTNNSTKSAAQFAAKLSRIGIPAESSQVFTTISAVTSLLERRWPRTTPVFAIGERPLLEAIEDGGYHLTAVKPKIVVLGFDAAFDYAKLRTAVGAALAGATVIATNPDVLTPVHDGYDPCVGVITAAVAAAVPNARPIVLGKPQPFLIEQALAHLGTARHETVMVGDQVGTDIPARKAAGMRSILLASDVPFNAVADVVPDRIIASLLDLAPPEAAGWPR